VAVSDRPPRVRPGFRRLAIGAFIVLTPIALHTAWDHYEARRLAQLVTDIRSRNEPVVSPLAGIGPRSQSSQNAARYYEAAAALVEPGAALYGPTGLLHRMETAPVADRSRLLEELRAWLERNREAETLLTRATELPFEGYLPGTDYSFRFDRLYRLVNVANFRAFERLEAGDAEAAADAVVRQLRIGRPLTAGGPTNLSILNFSGVLSRSLPAMGGLIESGPSDVALQRVQTAIRELDNDAAIEQSTIAERAFWLGRHWDDRRHWYARQRDGSGLEWYLVRPYMTRRLIATGQIMSELIANARRPWPERLEVDVPPQPSTNRVTSAFPFLSRVQVEYTLRHSYRSRASAVANSLVLGRTADAAIAVARYQRAAGGALPRSLGDLVPAYLTAVPIDPFTGREVRYSRSADRYVVYSFGPDKKDDGGVQVTDPAWASGMRRSRNPPPDLGVSVRIQPKRR
jgi:hypothetical protein